MFFFVYISAIIIASCAGQNSNVTQNEICSENNAYYKVHGSCDSYVECNDYKETNKTCPDGLYFIKGVQWPAYPCAYPSDTQCDDHDSLQPARSTHECKTQFGFFASPLATRSDCGKYRMCAEGQAFEMECPVGLAFNPETGRCDWPDLVPSCNADEFLGFKCPASTYDEYGKTYVKNFGIPGSCHYFFSCMEGVARLLVCDPGFKFDISVNRCVHATRVNCVEGA